MATYWRDEIDWQDFCPACGHGLIFDTLDEVIKELAITDKIIFGYDLGCVMYAWDNPHGGRTLYGEGMPVVAAVKQALPAGVAIIYLGDGIGYAYGWKELEQLAVKNELVTILLCNNCDYQAAPEITEEEEEGYYAIGAGADTIREKAASSAFVARTTVDNTGQMKEMIKQALEHQMAGTGISIVEIKATCPPIRYKE